MESAALIMAILLAAWLAVEPFWWLPALVAAVLLAIALWYDMRSLSRRLIPEIAGSVAIASVAAMGSLAGGATWPLAIGLWAILCARIVSSIPHVRAQILRIHGRRPAGMPTIVGDVAALTVAGVAVLLDGSLLLGALAIVGLILIQRATLAQPPRPAKVLGVRQMALGFAVVGVTAMGVWLL